ncbi:MAG: response regulator transcription factor [Rhodospirillales bacterium]|nr:response regulator transcription factor [Rhodospirillales bacterium]
MRILLIEDDEMLGSAIREQVAADQHAVDWLTRLADAEVSTRTARYDLILLDLMLPDGRGLDFLNTVRAAGNTTPVIILTARDQISERIEGLNAGADDYLVKPFDLAELTARIAAVQRRYTGNPNPMINLGDLQIDLAAKKISKHGTDIILTAREWRLLEALMQRPGVIFSKAQLEESLYNFDAEFESNTVEVHVSRLRKKLGHAVIETMRGAGYRLGQP